MNDPGLNSVLKWGIENSTNDTSAGAPGATQPSRGLNADALAQLLGGPSDADRMRDAMAAIKSPEVDLESKLIAFDNFEQLIEQLDNANNMESLGMWMPLIEELKNEEAELRRMTAWCLATAVQNNIRSQERLLVNGAVPTLVDLAINDSSEPVRKKAILAVSSTIRNFQPGLDAAQKSLPTEYHSGDKIDAEDMEAVDTIVQRLRDNSSKLAGK